MKYLNGRDTVALAVTLVAVGVSPESAFAQAQWVGARIVGRTYDELMSLGDLEAFAKEFK